jgi:hypothetical protein
MRTRILVSGCYFIKTVMISRLLEILERPVAPGREHLNNSNAKYAFSVLMHTWLCSRSALSKLRIRDLDRTITKKATNIHQARGRRGSITGDPGGCVKEGSGDGHLSP